MMALISFEAASTFTICTYTSVPAALTKLQLYSITCKTTNLHNQYICVIDQYSYKSKRNVHKSQKVHYILERVGWER